MRPGQLKGVEFYEIVLYFPKKLPHKYFEFSDVGCWKLVVGGYGSG